MVGLQRVPSVSNGRQRNHRVRTECRSVYSWGCASGAGAHYRRLCPQLALWVGRNQRKALAGLSPSLPVRFHGDQETEISQTETLPPMNHVTEGRSIHRVKTLSIAWLHCHGLPQRPRKCGFLPHRVIGSLKRRAGLIERNGETADWHAGHLGKVAADIDRPVVSVPFGQ